MKTPKLKQIHLSIKQKIKLSSNVVFPLVTLLFFCLNCLLPNLSSFSNMRYNVCSVSCSCVVYVKMYTILINTWEIYLILGDQAGAFNRQEAFKRERHYFILITVTSSTKLIIIMLSAKTSRELKDSTICGPSIHLDSLKIQYHSFKSQHQCKNPRSGLLHCHRQAILTLNLTLNKMTNTKLC